LSDIIKGVLAGSWGLLAGWVPPVGVAIALFGVLVLPSLGEWTAFMALASSSAGVKGNADAVAKRRNESGTSAVMLGLVLEKFNRYPDDADQVGPTLLGNAIRRFEYYSFDRYRLDSQLCWYHLRAVAPESMGKEVDNARSGVDFFVCLLYMLILLAMTAVAAMFTPSPEWFRLGIATALGVVGPVGSYYAAVKATDSWSSSVKAMVDIGRIPLAKALGLEIPATLAQERDMWQRVDWLLAFAYKPQAGTELDSYRQSSHTNSQQVAGLRSPDPPLGQPRRWPKTALSQPGRRYRR
jgi:hypothetical protein